MVEAVASKWQILREAGYEYNFDRMVYFNRGAKKAFSVEFVEDHSENELQSYIREETNGMVFLF